MKIVNSFVLFCMIGFVLVAGSLRTSLANDCEKKCKESCTQCENRCTVMRGDNTMCFEWCKKQLAECMEKCSGEKKSTEERPEEKIPEEKNEENPE